MPLFVENVHFPNGEQKSTHSSTNPSTRTRRTSSKWGRGFHCECANCARDLRNLFRDPKSIRQPLTVQITTDSESLTTSLVL